MATKQLFVPPVPPAPMLATPSAVPTGDQWVFEAKWDGARLAASCSGDRALLYSRRGTNLSGSFPEICHMLPEALNGHSAILDGEIVALDNHARPSFQRLQRRLHVSRPSANLQAALPTTLVVFDILQIDGTDVTGLPYLKRRELLEDLWLGRAGPRIVTPPVWSDISGDIVLDVMRELGLEGVVAKAATSTYHQVGEVDTG